MTDENITKAKADRVMQSQQAKAAMSYVSCQHKNWHRPSNGKPWEHSPPPLSTPTLLTNEQNSYWREEKGKKRTGMILLWITCRHNRL